MAEKQESVTQAIDQVAATEGPSAGEQASTRVHVRVDERHMATGYANGFRAHSTPEELLIDFGLNLGLPTPQRGQNDGGSEAFTREMVFQVNHRIIMNYYMAKRLAVSLAQTVRVYEQQFGELELNAGERAQGDELNRPSVTDNEKPGE